MEGGVMRKLIFCLSVGGTFFALTTMTIAFAASTTSRDVATLSKAESNVVALLNQYKPTGAWKARFDAAVSVQTADIARVNADLSPSRPNAHSHPSGIGATLKVMSNDGPYSVTLLALGVANPDDLNGPVDSGTHALSAEFRITDMRMSRFPWNFGDGPRGFQATS
jgi:hypothetical protein